MTFNYSTYVIYLQNTSNKSNLPVKRPRYPAPGEKCIPKNYDYTQLKPHIFDDFDIMNHM